jgi:hypothetical protein
MYILQVFYTSSACLVLFKTMLFWKVDIFCLSSDKFSIGTSSTNGPSKIVACLLTDNLNKELDPVSKTSWYSKTWLIQNSASQNVAII